MDSQTRAAGIRIAIFDIDGVMTDGGLHYTDDGHELKTFNVQDGLGLKFLQRNGIELAIITGRTGGVVTRRADDLGIAHVFLGVGNKGEAAGKLLAQLGFDWSACAFMGDDLIDLPAMRRCGLAIAPANARPQVRERAHLVTETRGGHGAVREAAEFILNAQGKFDAVLQSYLDLP
jgi:3-deoxy-D-manno-octulosonate 8-phosphate phosphatase (KDO 8-P phosphatase)